MASEQLIEDLVRLWRVLHQLSAPTQQGELTAQQFWLLRQLRREGPTRIGILAAALGIGQSAVTTACKRLEQAGLVTRTRTLADERGVLVSPTPSGEARVDAWREQRRERLLELLIVLDPAEQAQLQHLLARLLAGTKEATT